MSSREDTGWTVGVDGAGDLFLHKETVRLGSSFEENIACVPYQLNGKLLVYSIVYIYIIYITNIVFSNHIHIYILLHVLLNYNDGYHLQNRTSKILPYCFEFWWTS